LRLGFCDKTLGYIGGEEEKKRMSYFGGLVEVILACCSSLVELGFSLFSLAIVLES
jgi:hypothetical protein